MKAVKKSCIERYCSTEARAATIGSIPSRLLGKKILVIPEFKKELPTILGKSLISRNRWIISHGIGISFPKKGENLKKQLRLTSGGLLFENKHERARKTRFCCLEGNCRQQPQGSAQLTRRQKRLNNSKYREGGEGMNRFVSEKKRADSSSTDASIFTQTETWASRETSSPIGAFFRKAAPTFTSASLFHDIYQSIVVSVRKAGNASIDSMKICPNGESTRIICKLRFARA
jgi:hypothetical protein